MNNLLNIKLKFNHEKNRNKPGPRNLNKTRKTTANDLRRLVLELKKVKEFYSQNDKYVNGVLIDVYYNDIISKSGRIKEVLKIKGECNDSIVGARFTDGLPGIENHIITHYVEKNVIDVAIDKLLKAADYIDKYLNGEATSDNFDSSLPLDYSKCSLKKTKLRDIIIDCSVIEKFDIPNVLDNIEMSDSMVVTFYKTELNIYSLLNELGIDRDKYYYAPAGENTLFVDKNLLNVLLTKVPHLISMAVSDVSEISFSTENKDNRKHFDIPKPTNQPIIGVIDTLFDKSVYFGEWVDYHEVLEFFEETNKNESHYEHGTSVTSIIVDGPRLNPWLEDNCGMFRVRHFGVCLDRISITSLVRKLERIVQQNQDIHVWNLSLGTSEEVSKNFISFDGAALDALEQKYNVIFVIAGTNDIRNNKKDYLRVGSPADSINSVVVNSVRKDGSPVSYSRKGKILSFFNKPDVSYYGGDFDERITVYSSKGIDEQYGTSFAAPWIARKLCYLIDILGFTREVAKALLIDSAAGWEYKQGQYKLQNIIGFGVVPKDISKVVECDNSEIKFTLTGTAHTFATSNYAIPVPKDEGNKSYYIARATLCYFPECNRLQGVDYTQRELSLKFGIVVGDTIKDINKNTQDDENEYNNERKARSDFRKWENTKFISSLLGKNRGLTLYNEGFWGVSLTSKERKNIATMEDLNFGVVITLKNIQGKNRIDEFKHACLLRGYIVNDVKIKNQISIYNTAQEEVKFD